jgi:hypothetical protein
MSSPDMGIYVGIFEEESRDVKSPARYWQG